ncbi:MAG: hypothetical protein KDE54_24625 [Caldilineaceae bacterium]|nr:hypothetical protein [Caldilineaceae bacterium]MCB0139949.1 hypothetical protein [Caldilineaceae bacterium]
MLPIAVIPLNDPTGLLLPHVPQILPQLKRLFARTYVSLTLPTQQRQPDFCQWVREEPHFDVLEHAEPLAVGQDFSRLYERAATSCAPEQMLHLCFIDRVAYALQSAYKDQFEADIQRVTLADTPLIFARSAAAWQTHPANYYAVEQMIVQAGELLLGQALDFAWCHLVLSAAQLRTVLPKLQSPNIDIVAEFVIHLRHQIQTIDVDWLAWEDPFVYQRDPQQLQQERASSLAETQKRFNYAVPMLQHLLAASRIE